MYITTFYSYKGGVGRSMALINIASYLASKGKRVLIVDFDLEAPGINTYTQFSRAKCHSGIVDYVHEFLATNIAPDVAQFIVKCELNSGCIWVMPAGDHSSDQYSSRLNSINWLDVYRDHSGFLMIEDLKQQWRLYDGKGFDYVFIDSRTGHTDVGGICTRQMPDAVVFMYFPNEQNISGLIPIVDSVRQYAIENHKYVPLHFCPSNVPDIDDENNILDGYLKSASLRLKYSTVAGMISHYSSLDLVDQVIFTIDRPKTKLSNQYIDLCTEITVKNLEDRDGAVIALGRMSDKVDAIYKNPSKELVNNIVKFDEDATKIREFHKLDPEIGWLLADFYLRLRDRDDEVEMLGWAIDGGYQIGLARLQRANALLSLNEREKCVEDLRSILLSNRLSASAYELVPAVEMLSVNDPEWISVINEARVLRNMDDAATIRLLSTLTTNVKSMPLAEKICKERIQTSKNAYLETYKNKLELILIKTHKFTEFMNNIKQNGDIIESKSIADIYNYAICQWASTEIPPIELMELVHNLSKTVDTDRQDSNFFQCLMVANSVLDNEDEVILSLLKAREKLPSNRGRIFSTWSFLEVTVDEMRSHLNEMEQLAVAEKPLRPPFFDEPELPIFN